MADHQGYTIHTHYIPVDVFLGMIESDIIKLINTYGHKNCGLRHEELCDEIRKIITDNKRIVFRYMDTRSKTKWSKDWDSQRSIYFNKLFQEEGFINMCFPTKYKNNPRLYQLLSKHIQFCKEKDERLLDLGKNPEYDACRQYNIWINGKTTSFTREYLENVRDFERPTVHKYFSTKEHPGGHDPLETYRNIKLDCNLYKSPSKNHQQKQVDNTPTRSLHLPTSSDVGQESQRKGGKSMSDEKGKKEITKPNVKQPPQTEPSSSDSQTPSLANTKLEDNANGQLDDLKAKGTGLTNNAQDSTGKSTRATNAKAPSFQQVPEPPSLTSPKDSLAATVPNIPSVIKVQDTDTDATLSTTSATSGATHSIQNISSPSAPDLSLAKPQPPAVAAVTDQNSKKTTPPDPVIKSKDHGAPLTSALDPHTSLDPGLAPSKAAASNSSEIGTSSKSVTTNMASTAGLPPTQDPLLIKVPPQPIVTTSVATTLTQTTSVMSHPSTATVSAIVTQPIPSINGNKSTIEDSKEAKASLKTISDPHALTSASPKKQDDLTAPSIGAQSPGSSANLNINPSTGQTLGTSPGLLGPLPDSPADSPADPPPGLSSHISPGRSPEESPDVSPALLTVVNKPAKPTADNLKITTSPKYAPPHYIGTTLISNTPSPKVTYPSEKPSIEPTEFPPLMNIIPTTLILLTTLTILFLLYKYTPFGLFLGRRRRRRKKKKDLRTVFEIPEESTYESPNETIHEWDDHLGRQKMENDVYVKLQKINRYKKEMQKKKKKRDTTLIEVHMEILEECKNDEWELHKGDFLEICLQEFINEKNRTAANWPNVELTVNNIKNNKIIQDTEEKEILWNFWMDNYRNILESRKSEEWFQNLKNEWKKERQKNHNKINRINKIEENTLKETEMISIECEKDIWKKWILKQATLIENFKQEDWFKSLVAEQYKEEDNYEINEYMNVLNTNMNEVEKGKKYHEFFRKKNIINKLMVQMHVMVLEECKKEEIIENKELCIDNYIQSIHKKNNYDEKSNIL